MVAVLVQSALAIQIGVDGKAPSTGNWKIAKYKTLKVFQGVDVVFDWMVNHDVALAPTSVAWKTCVTTAATSLHAPTNTGNYVFTTADKKLGKYYVYCAVAGHCAVGQKVTIQIVKPPACASAKTSTACAAIPKCAWSGTVCA
jgi:hypothetical protein